jgi:hypothetical protein
MEKSARAQNSTSGPALFGAENEAGDRRYDHQASGALGLGLTGGPGISPAFLRVADVVIVPFPCSDSPERKHPAGAGLVQLLVVRPTSG